MNTQQDDEVSRAKAKKYKRLEKEFRRDRLVARLKGILIGVVLVSPFLAKLMIGIIRLKRP